MFGFLRNANDFKEDCRGQGVNRSLNISLTQIDRTAKVPVALFFMLCRRAIPPALELVKLTKERSLNLIKHRRNSKSLLMTLDFSDLIFKMKRVHQH